MGMESTMETVKAIKAQMDAAKAAMQEAGRAAFADGCKALFAEFPGLESFTWRQYTPYFNDGDACVFGVQADCADINGVDGDDIGYGDRKDLKPTQDAVVAFIDAFPAEVMESLFGDHVKVTVTKDGAVADGYEHD